MNSNKYSDLLEKYYNGETTIEEERWLKDHAKLSQEPLPLAEPDNETPAMKWSFEEFLAVAEAPSKKAGLRNIQPMKYAAAVATVVLMALALYTFKKEKITTKATDANEMTTVAGAKQMVDDTLHIEKAENIPSVAIATHKPRKAKKYPLALKPAVTQQKNDDFFVVVNGRRITDENEALAILHQSLNAMSGDVKETMAGINNFPKLDVKFK